MSTVVRTALCWLLLTSTATADPPASKETLVRAKAHFKAAQAFLEAADYDHSVEQYLAAYAALPAPDLLFNIGQALRLKGDKEGALGYFRRYVVALPEGRGAVEARRWIDMLQLDDAVALQKEGIARYKAGEVSAAEAAFARVCELAPAYATPHWWLGIVRARAGDCAGAVVHLEFFLQHAKEQGSARAREAIAARDRCTQPEKAQVATSTPAAGHRLDEDEDGMGDLVATPRSETREPARSTRTLRPRQLASKTGLVFGLVVLSVVVAVGAGFGGAILASPRDPFAGTDLLFTVQGLRF